MEKKQPTFLQAAIPFIGMIIFISVGYVILGLRIELMLSLAALISGIIAWRLGYSWADMQEAICIRMKKITPAVLIMWCVGIVIGTFMFSGSIPVIIYYGMKLVNPSYLIAFSFLITLILATVTGTSWGSSGTVGVAMVGLAIGLDVSVPMVAGAVISGAIFGDKMSPLSDTTNLCPAATGGVDLYEHIKHMWYTTLPAAIIAGIIYLVIGFVTIDSAENASSDSAQSMIDGFAEMYDFSGINSVIMLIPLVIVLGGAAIKKPTVPTMLIASLVAIGIGMYCNGFTLVNGTNAAINGFSGELTNVDIEGIDPNIATLITRGGMKGMIGIIIIVYTGYAFTAIWSMTGGIETMFRPVISKVNTRASVVTSAVVITTVLDGACGTSYVPAIIVPELFREKYIKLGLHLKNLSRTLEDAGTCLNAIWPWSMSGIYFATTLGVATLDYLPYVFLCYLTPLIAIFCGITGFGIAKLTDEQKEAELKRIQEDD